MKKIKELRSETSTKVIAIIVGILFLAAIIPGAIVFADYTNAVAGKTSANAVNKEVITDVSKDAALDEGKDAKDVDADATEKSDKKDTAELNNVIAPVPNEVTISGKITQKGGDLMPSGSNPYALIIGFGDYFGTQKLVSPDPETGLFSWTFEDESFAGFVYAGAEGFVNNIIYVDSAEGITEANFALKEGKTCHFVADENPGLLTTVIKAGSFINWDTDNKFVFDFDLDLGLILENNLPIGFPTDVTLTLGTLDGLNVVNYYYNRPEVNQTINLNIEVAPIPGYHFYSWLLNGELAWGTKKVADIEGASFYLTPVFESDNVTVKGQVTNDDKNPVVEADVEFISDDKELTKNTKSDKDGKYELVLPRAAKGTITFSKDDYYFGSAQAEYSPLPIVPTYTVDMVLNNSVDVLIDGGEGLDSFVLEYYVDGEQKGTDEVDQIKEKLYKTSVVTYEQDGTITVKLQDADETEYLTKITIKPKEGCLVDKVMIGEDEFKPGDQFVITEAKDVQGLVTFKTDGPHPGPIPPAPTPDPDNPPSPVVPGNVQTGDLFNLAAACAAYAMIAVISCISIATLRKKED